jgi:hypothetical protein
MTEEHSATGPEGATNPKPPLDQPWSDDDGRGLATLLAMEEGPGSSPQTCTWFLGRLDVDHPDVRIAAWRIAWASMRHRCGETSAFELWERSITSGPLLSDAERRRVDPFLTSVFGTPESPVPSDHLEGHCRRDSLAPTNQGSCARWAYPPQRCSRLYISWKNRSRRSMDQAGYERPSAYTLQDPDTRLRCT